MKFFSSGSGCDKISCIGLGTIGAGDRDKATQTSIKLRHSTLEYGLDRGINFIDCGEDYEGGFAEEVLGRFLMQNRNRVFLGTKFSPANNSREKLRKALEGSLKRLNTDRIDLYQLHWPNPSVPIEETMETLALLKQEGKIRYIGVGNCSFQMVREAESALAGERILSNQIKLNPVCNPTFSEPNYFEDSATHGLLSLAYGIMGQGKLQIPAQTIETIKELCLEKNLSHSQLFLLWALSHPNTGVIIRSMNYKHLDEHLSVADMKLSPLERDWLSALFACCQHSIPIKNIRVADHDPDPTHPIYTSLEEALANRFNLCPSVEMLALQIANGQPFQPVEVLEAGIIDGECFYELVQGRMRFWAWIYHHGSNSVVPAVVLGKFA